MNFDPAAGLLVEFLDLRAVGGGDDDRRQPGTARREHLLAHAADRQDRVP